MVERSVCPHCSFRNFSVSKVCARCEKPLGPHDAKAAAPAAPPAAAPRQAPVAPARSAKERAAALSRRTTAPLTTPPPAAPRVRAPVAPASNRPVSMAEGPRVRPAASPHASDAPLGGAPPVDAAEAATRIGIPLQDFAPRPPEAAPIEGGRKEPVFAPPAQEGPAKKRRTSKPLVPARLWQHAVAALLDVLAVVAIGALWGGFEMLIKGGGWPSGQATFLESLAMWLHIYARTAKRMTALMVAFSVGHTMYGVRTGKTLGRMACGLLLVGMGGGKPTKGGTWGATLWHSTGGILSFFTLGAGHFWMLVDGQRRTWANLLGRTLVVQNAKRQGTARP